MAKAAPEEPEVKEAEAVQEATSPKGEKTSSEKEAKVDGKAPTHTTPEEKEASSSQQPSAQMNNQAQKVDEQTNIQGQSVTFIKQVFTRKAHKPKKPSADENKKPEATQPRIDPLPRRPAGILDVEIAAHAQLVAEWSSRRTILLSSFQPEAALAAAYSLIQDTRFSGHDKRTLLLSKGQNHDGLEVTIENFTRPDFLERRQQIVLVEIERASSFLDSILHIGHNHAAVVQDLLRERDSLLICTAKSETLKLGPDQRLIDGFPFGHHSIPFLPYLLGRHFPPSRASELNEILLAQLKRFLFQSVTDLYEQVTACLVDGPERLEEIVRRNEELPRGISVWQSREEAQTVKPSDVFQEDSGVHAAVLYTATYFPDLTPQDFERIIVLLLEAREVSEETEEQILTEQGEVRTLKKHVPRRLVDLWKETPDRILRECRLRSAPLSDGTHAMDFSVPYLRRELRSYLESHHPMFLVRMFERLQEEGLLFNPEASATVIDNLVRLFVERTLADPAFCGKDWLIGFAISLQRQSPAPTNGAAPSDPTERLLQIIAQANDRVQLFFLGRLAQLIREMLQHDALRNMVRDFFSILLEKRQQRAALDLLLALTRRLRFAPQFDALYWIRRLMDQGTTEIRDETSQCLLEIALESGPRIFELLGSLHRWLPEADLETSRYPLSSRYVLRFLLEYSSEALCRFDPKYLGEWPSRYPLFAATPDDPERLRSRMDLLGGWLLHRGMPKFFVTWVGDGGIDPGIEWEEWFNPEEAHAGIVADLVEQWVLILEGTDPQKTHPEARRISDALLASIDRQTDAAQRKRLIRRWQWQQQEYMIQVNQLPVERREERSRLLATRKKVNELRQRFSTFRSGGASSEGIP